MIIKVNQSTMKNLLHLMMLFVPVILNAQCDDYITKSYDKFTKKTTESVKKELYLEKNGFSFKLKPQLPANLYSAIEVSGSNHTQLSQTMNKKVDVIILFSDSTALELYDDQHYSSGTFNNEQLLISFAPFSVSTEYMDSLDQMQKDFMQKMKIKKIAAIRFSGMGMSNIDIDLVGEQQIYFMSIYNCL